VVVVVGYPPPALAPVVGPTRSMIAPTDRLTTPRIVRRPRVATAAKSGSTVLSILRRADAPKPDMPIFPFKVDTRRTPLWPRRSSSPCLPATHAPQQTSCEFEKEVGRAARLVAKARQWVQSHAVSHSLRPSRRTQRIRRGRQGSKLGRSRSDRVSIRSCAPALGGRGRRRLCRRS